MEITLRDQIAMAVLPTLMGSAFDVLDKRRRLWVAELAYDMADSVLEVRTSQKGLLAAAKAVLENRTKQSSAHDWWVIEDEVLNQLSDEVEEMESR